MMRTGDRQIHRPWSVNPVWLEVIGSMEEISTSLKEFMMCNSGTAAGGVVWDALKAFLRGLLIQQIARVKRKTRMQEDRIRN